MAVGLALSVAELQEQLAALTKELSEAREQQTTTADVLKIIGRSTYDLQAVLDTLTKSAARLCDADMAGITRQDVSGSFRHMTNYNFPPAWEEYMKSVYLQPGRSSVVGRVLLEGRPVQIADVLSDPEYALLEAVKTGGYRTCLGVPLLREGNPIGVIILARKTVAPFTDKQIELATTFADQAVIAIENARLFEAEQRQSRELSQALERQTATAEVLNVISRSTFQLQPVLDSIVQTASRLCNAETALIFMFRDEKLHLVATSNASSAFVQPCLSGCHPQPLAVVLGHAHGRSPGNLRFPQSLPEFQRLFPDDAACAGYLEKARWSDGFVCPHCQAAGEPFRFANRLGVLRCRKCRRDTGLTVGTVMARSHTPLSVWFWSAYLVSSQTPGMSAVQLRRQLGLSRYETAFQILHKLRAGMVRPDQDRIGGRPGEHVEVDETWVGGRTRGKGRGVHDKVLVASAVEVRQRKPGTKLDKRKGGRYAGRVRLAIVPDRSAESLCGFVECAVVPGTSLVTDDWSGYASLAKRGYKHLAIAERGDPQVAEEYLPIIHLVFANLETWLNGIHHGVSHQHLQAYLNEFTFRFNRRFYPFNAFRSLLGIAGDITAPTYAELYSGAWQHPTCWGCG